MGPKVEECRMYWTNTQKAKNQHSQLTHKITGGGRNKTMPGSQGTGDEGLHQLRSNVQGMQNKTVIIRRLHSKDVGHGDVGCVGRRRGLHGCQDGDDKPV